MPFMLVIPDGALARVIPNLGACRLDSGMAPG
jgi:hypothetical protein